MTGASMIQSKRPHSLHKWVISSSLLLSNVFRSIMATCKPSKYHLIHQDGGVRLKRSQLAKQRPVHVTNTNTQIHFRMHG